jgi:hypothetical protein
MKWFKRKVKNWLFNEEEYGIKAVSIRDSSSVENDPILHFKIFAAQNGKILEFRRYDTKTDRSHTTTYIIDKETDIGDYVSKCVSLELMK